jgi:predicted DNA-binding transcriptional regulator AlpA
MTALVDPRELVGSAEAAKIAGISAPALKKHRQRGTAPEPLVLLTSGPLWLRSTIEQWAADRAARRP